MHQLVVLALLDRDLALPLVRRDQVGGRVQVHLARLEGDEGLGAGLAHPAAAEEGTSDCHCELRKATKEDFLQKFYRNLQNVQKLKSCSEDDSAIVNKRGSCFRKGAFQ